jgi:c-di-GMP-binding flagellar brake protein YcgR
MDEERRRSIRIKKPLTVQYSHMLDNKTVWDMSFIKDLSDTGMCISTNRTFPLNEIFFIRIKVPIKPFLALETEGKVVESKETKTSGFITRVEFINLKEEEKELIREYIAWILVKERSKK